MRDPNSKISLGEHAALGQNESRFTSASTLPKGSPGGPRHGKSRLVYIDEAKARASGATIHSTQEIVADIERLINNSPRDNSEIRKLLEEMKPKIEFVEKEVLIEGNVPSQAIKSRTSMNLTKGLQVIQIGGFVLTAYDLGTATVKSIRQESIRPIAAESIRQVGGWSGATLAAATIGGQLGATVGIESGPGMIITGAVGALTFGAAGYLGADWIADFIDEN